MKMKILSLCNYNLYIESSAWISTNNKGQKYFFFFETNKSFPEKRLLLEYNLGKRFLYDIKLCRYNLIIESSPNSCSVLVPYVWIL